MAEPFECLPALLLECSSALRMVCEREFVLHNQERTIISMATMQPRAVSPSTKEPAPPIPRVSPWLINRFDWYLQRYVPKHFHAFALNNSDAIASIEDTQPLIVYMNHASWWDPLIALLLAKHCFATRRLYAPIDAVAVKKYPFMQRLGFFPVAQNRMHGAKEFLKTARAILQHTETSIWLTPEGQFADPRQRDLPFQPGLAHLVSKLEEGFVVPLAVEYPFWEERLPEVLARFGTPISIEAYRGQGKDAWRQLLESQLRETQQELEALSLARDSAAFEILFSGTTGVNWLYDLMRRCTAVFTGKKLEQSHGNKLQ